MKSYLHLVIEYEKSHKSNNRITIICIAIAVCLVTAIFGIADMEARAQRIRQINEGGYWHMALSSYNDEMIHKLLDTYGQDINASGQVMGFDEDQVFIFNDEDFCLAAGDEEIATQLGLEVLEGSYPTVADEVLIDQLSAQQQHISVGDTLCFQIPGQGEQNLKVTGLCNNTAKMMKKGIHAIVILPSLAQEYFDSSVYRQMYHIQFKEAVDKRSTIDSIKETLSLSDEDVSENTALLALEGQSRDPYMMQLYGVAFALFTLVLVAGILMISGTFNTNVVERTQFFGMLRCLGATKTQISRYVLLESLRFLRIAVPIGVITGTLVYWGLCAYLKFVNYAFFATMPLLKFSPVSVLSGIGIGITTVLLAALAPAKRASRVSPLSAIIENQYTNHGMKEQKYHVKLHFRIENTLGIYHATSNRKNLFLMTGSFAISIILFLSFSVVVNFMNHAITPMEAWTPDIEVSPVNNENTLDKHQIEQLEKIDGVKNAYGRNYLQGTMVVDGADVNTSLLTYETHQFKWAKKYLVAGNINTVVEGQNQAIVAYSLYHNYRVGDTLTLTVNGQSHEITIAAIVNQTPFKVFEEDAVVILNETSFERINGNCGYAVIDIQLEGNATDETVALIRNTVGDVETFADLRMSNAQGRAINYSFSVFVYGFMAIIALITIFNIINSINMSITAHLKQYDVMHAVGMSIRQIKRMICAEAATYSVCGCFLGSLIGLILHKILFSMMITFHWGSTWSIPCTAIIVIILLVIGSTVISVIGPGRKLDRRHYC